ncbi:AI-2E family transporter [Cribrihabitans neustonicus]|uniref:AI-2E family transporter n=1 Tax=Cribrihabitans neustonicus TaxID=1429085 RepID=UPI003B58F157
MTAPRPAPDAGSAPAIQKGLRFAVLGIFILLLIHTLVWANDFLIPVTAAFLGFFVLNRPRRWLDRLGVPPMLAAAIFTVLMVAAVGFALLRFSEPVSRFISDLPGVVEEIDAKLSTRGGPLEAVDKAAKATAEILDPKPEGAEETVEVEVVSDNSVAALVATLAPALLGKIAFAILLLFFLLASGDMFLRKTVQSIGHFRDKRRAVEIVHHIEDRLGRYLGGICAINAGLGVFVAAAMMAWGMPNPLMIGTMAFLFNFVPYIGALLGATIAGILAFVSIEGIWPAAGVWLTYMALTSIEGQLVTPMLISRRLHLNTTVVFLSVAFFAWIWSIMGMVVALPILTVIKIACDEIDGLQTVAMFLGDDQEAEPPPEREKESGG